MNSNEQKFTGDDALQSAADWWVRLRDRKDIDDLSQWLEWSSTDARHAEAYERITELGVQIRSLDTETKADLLTEFAPPDRIRHRRWLPLATAASLLLAALAGAGYYAGHSWFHHIDEETFTSQVDEDRNIVLDDGSKVALGGASSIKTRFSKERREVFLNAGEAFFQVAHNANRPFIVSAGTVSVRAVGTAFDVRRDGQSITISMAEGRVRIADGTAAASDAGAAVEATAGQQVSYDPSVSGFTFTSIDPEKAAAWRNRQLDFVDTPLETVAANINRYSRRPLEITDAELKNLNFTGTVDLDQLDSWVNALPYVMPVKVTATAERITLSPAARKRQ